MSDAASSASLAKRRALFRATAGPLAASGPEATVGGG